MIIRVIRIAYMAESIIHVIPEAYWGGKEPKPAPKEVAPATSFGVERPQVKRMTGWLKGRTIFLASAGILFIAVVGAAAWYFTRPLREARPAPALPSPSPSGPTEEAPPPAPERPELPTPAVEPPPSIPPPPPPPSPDQDTDSDGLSDVEEELYRSEKTVPDTDADGFLDGHEVFNLYNPSGTAPERLEAAELALRHKNEAMGYEVLFPVTWRIIPKDAEHRTLLFTPAEGGGIEITAVENLGGLTLQGWLEAQQPGAALTLWSANKAGLEGYVGPDGLTFYFAGGQRIYVLKYAPEGGVGPYKRTVEMMANSFVIR